MFSNRGYISKNGTKSLHDSERTLFNSLKRGRYINIERNLRRMETKLIITVINVLGITSYVSAIILNIGSWKADILWGLAVLFGIVKFIRYSLKTWQDYRRGEIEIESERHKLK